VSHAGIRYLPLSLGAFLLILIGVSYALRDVPGEVAADVLLAEQNQRSNKDNEAFVPSGTPVANGATIRDANNQTIQAQYSIGGTDGSTARRHALAPGETRYLSFAVDQASLPAWVRFRDLTFRVLVVKLTASASWATASRFPARMTR